RIEYIDVLGPEPGALVDSPGGAHRCIALLFQSAPSPWRLDALACGDAGGNYRPRDGAAVVACTFIVIRPLRRRCGIWRISRQSFVPPRKRDHSATHGRHPRSDTDR